MKPAVGLSRLRLFELMEKIEELLDDCDGTLTLSAILQISNMQRPVGPNRIVVVDDVTCWMGGPAEKTPLGKTPDKWLVFDPISSSLVYMGVADTGVPFTHTLQGGDIFMLNGVKHMMQQITRMNIVASVGPISRADSYTATIHLARIGHIFPTNEHIPSST